MPHWGIKPASVVCQSHALSTELPPCPTPPPPPQVSQVLDFEHPVSCDDPMRATHDVASHKQRTDSLLTACILHLLSLWQEDREKAKLFKMNQEGNNQIELLSAGRAGKAVF